MKEPAKHRVVILGGGFGGLAAARQLGGANVEVTLVDRENHHLFQPLLYQVATASLAPGSIAMPIRGVLSGQKNTRVILGEASELDRERQELVLADGERLPYDSLVISVGCRTNYFGHEEEWAPHAPGLKSVRDAIDIRERILLAFEAAERCEDAEERKRLTTFVVIGGGPTGVEMAGAISELGRQVLAHDYRRIAPEDIRVVLVEMAKHVLTPFDEDLSYSAERQLQTLGVELALETRVTSVDARGVEIEGPKKDRINASVVVWATGVAPESFAEASGLTLDRSGRIRVDSHCAALGHANIFAIGDVAAFVPEGESEALPGLGAVAMQQGKHVAVQIRRDLKRQARKTFEYADRGIMATIGRSRAVVQASIKLEGFFAWLAWCFVHVVLLMGFRNRAIVLFNWTWSYLTFKRGARLISGRRPSGPRHGD
ncbi:MAG: NADH dehydrogenase [Polyangiales bacterium]